MAIIRMNRMTYAEISINVKYPLPVKEEVVTEEARPNLANSVLRPPPMPTRPDTVRMRVGVQIFSSEIEIDRDQIKAYLHTLYQMGDDNNGLDTDLRTFAELSHELLAKMHEYFPNRRLSVEAMSTQGWGGYSIVGEAQ